MWLRYDRSFPPPLHKCRGGRTRASSTCLEDQLGGIVGMWRCAAPSAWRRLSLSQHYVPGSSRASFNRSLICPWVPKVRGTLVGHLSSPGCRINTDHRCLIGCCQRLGIHPCSPRVAQLGLDDWVVPFHAWGGRKSW